MRGAVVLALLLVSAAWFWSGSRSRRLRAVSRGRRRREQPWRPLTFYAGLVAIALALVGPVERMSDQLLWAHMLQHLLLMLVAAPLLVLGAPWLPFWRPLPLGFRRRVASELVRGPRLASVRAAARWLAAPAVAWVLLNGDLALWHVPALYDLTLRNDGVHYLEHATFLAFAMLFWAQVVDSPPFHSRLDDFRKALYLTAGAAASWLLALVLAFSSTPLYSAYSSIQPRPEGISALTDQQLAAGIMLGPGSVPYALGVFCLLYSWLAENDVRRRRPHRRTVAAPGESR